MRYIDITLLDACYTIIRDTTSLFQGNQVAQQCLHAVSYPSHMS